MPSVLERFEQPSTREYDPLLLPDINFGFAESHPDGGDRILSNQREGSFGMLSAHNLSEAADRDTISLVAPLIEQKLDNSQFYFGDPEAYLRDVFSLAQAEVKADARARGEEYRTRIDMSLVKVYVDPADGALKAAYGHTGRHSITYSPHRQPPTGINRELDDDLREQGIGFPPIEEGAAEFGVMPFNEGDRLIIQSRNAAGYDQPEMYTDEELQAGLVARDPQEAARLLIQKNKTYPNRSALVIDAPYDYDDDQDETTGWQRFRNRLTRNRRDQTEVVDTGEGRRDFRTRMLGAAALMGVGGFARRRDEDGAAPSRWSQWRNRNRDDVIVDQETVVVDDRPRDYVVEEHEVRDERSSKRALKIGLLALGGYLVWRLGFDHGSLAESHNPLTQLLVGDKPANHGIDLWPFGDGDHRPGVHHNFDINPFNDSTWGSDDPANHTGIQLPTVSTPDLITQPPHIDIPVTPPVDIPAITTTPPVDVMTTPAVWHPESFTIQPGEGMKQVLHDLGHQQDGYNHFYSAGADKAYDALSSKYGSNLIDIPSHAGPGTYMQHGEVRLSSPGLAHWHSQAIEQAVREELQKAADLKA